MKMKYFSITILFAILACVAASIPSDCGGEIPLKLCKRLKNLENRLGRSVLRSTLLITKAVENAANRNAILFAKTVQVLRNVTKTSPMNETEFTKILDDLKQTFEKAEEARGNVSSQAMRQVGEASEKFAELVQKIIKQAVDDDHTDSKRFRERLDKVVKKSFAKIKRITVKAVDKVYLGSMKVEKYVIRVLSKLRVSHASGVQGFLSSLNAVVNKNIAEEAERELEAELEGTTDEVFQIIINTDNGSAKRNFQQFWAYVKSKLNALSALLVQKVREAVARMAPQVYQKIGEIVKIIINEAKRALVEIAGEIVMVTVP